MTTAARQCNLFGVGKKFKAIKPPSIGKIIQEIEFFIPRTPRTANGHKWNSRTRKPYEETGLLDDRRAIASIIRRKFKCNDVLDRFHPIEASIEFMFKATKDHPPGSWCLEICDLDNLQKHFGDGVQSAGTVIENDSQLVLLHLSKFYAEKEGIQVRLRIGERQNPGCLNGRVRDGAEIHYYNAGRVIGTFWKDGPGGYGAVLWRDGYPLREKVHRKTQKGCIQYFYKNFNERIYT